MASRTRNAYCSFCRKSYRDVGPLVEGPDEVYICGECIELTQSIIEQEKRRRQGTAEECSLEDLEEKLERCFRGQLEAKQVLSAAVRKHYQRLRRARQQSKPAQGDQRAILLVGPARSSKIYLARALAHIVGVPFAHGNAGELGGASSPLILNLLYASEFDINAAERGIVYIDGVEQQGAQQPLHALLDGSATCVFSSELGRELQVDTGKIFFLWGASFSQLGEIMARRGPHLEQPVSVEDLLAFGMAPEVVRRVQAIVRLDPLDEETLMRIVSWVDLKGLAAKDNSSEG
jgi:ATP-dependent Clp protease ATP-binding subunit ClpX